MTKDSIPNVLSLSQGFFTYLYGASILFLLYVFCFLLQESACCAGGPEAAERERAKREAEANRKREKERQKAAKEKEKADKDKAKKEKDQKKKDDGKGGKDDKGKAKGGKEGDPGAPPAPPQPDAPTPAGKQAGYYPVSSANGTWPEPRSEGRAREMRSDRAGG